MNVIASRDNNTAVVKELICFIIVKLLLIRLNHWVSSHYLFVDSLMFPFVYFTVLSSVRNIVSMKKRNLQEYIKICLKNVERAKPYVLAKHTQKENCSSYVVL